MKRIAGKNDVCREHLLSEIAVGIYRPGERLPAERELGEAYQVSRSTVRNALNELEELGIVERRPPVGTFVTGEALKRIEQLTAQPPRLRALFVMTTGQIDNPFLQRLFLALKNRMPEGVELTVRLSDSCCGIFEEEKPELVYLFGNYPDEELEEAAREVPHLMLLGRRHRNLNFVTCDDYVGGRLMAEAALRAAGVADVCKENGVRLQSHRMSLEESLNLTASTFLALDNFLRGDPELSMILALSDRHAISVMDCCRRRHLAVPVEISVIGCDDQCFVESIRPPLTTIRCSAEEIGEHLAAFAQMILDGGSGSRIVLREALTPFLVERKSVRILPIVE